MTLAEDPVVELQQHYPDWTFCKSGIGRIWALRNKGPDYAMQQAGAVVTLGADTCEDLALLLEKQKRIKAAPA